MAYIPEFVYALVIIGLEENPHLSGLLTNVDIIEGSQWPKFKMQKSSDWETQL